MSNRVSPAILFLALVLGGPGCLLHSRHAADARAPVDAAFLGTWRCLGFDSDSRAGKVVVARAGDQYSIVLGSEDGDPDTLAGYTSVVKGQTLLTVTSAKPRFPLPPWAVLRYSFLRPSVLLVQLGDEHELEGADASPVSFRNAFERARDEAHVFADYLVCVRTPT